MRTWPRFLRCFVMIPTRIAEQVFTCPFRQLMFLGQGRGKMLEGNGTAGFGRKGWFVRFV